MSAGDSRADAGDLRFIGTIQRLEILIIGPCTASQCFGFSSFTCPTPTTQVYLVALGGNPGLGGSVNNPAIAEAVAIGKCSTINTNSYFNINEVTTAAFATATQQFATSFSTVGAPSTNIIGLNTAFALAQDLANTGSGLARSTNIAGTGSVPATKLNTLGSIIASCVNSAGGGSMGCGNLFTATTPPGGTRATDTFGALLLIAQNPGNNVSTVNALSSPASPFQPSANVTNDFSIGITYSGGGMTAPGTVVIDASGNAFIANSPSTAGASGTDSIVGFGPNGKLLTGPTGFTAGIHKPLGIAIDSGGNIWSNNTSTGSTVPDQVVKMSAAGALTFAYNDSTISGLQGIAINANDNAWVSNQNNNSLVRINTAGTRILAPVTSGNFAAPTGVGIDGNGNVFAAGIGSNTILKFSANGAVPSPAGGYSVSGLNQPYGISIDNAGNVWTLNNVGSTLTKLTNTGTLIAPAAPVPNISNAYVLSIDGAGGAWFANCRAMCGANTTAPDNLTHVLASQAQATGNADGYQNANLSRVGTTAIDGAGNVWITNNANGTVTEFMGLASPVVTPLAVAAAGNKLGVRP